MDMILAFSSALWLGILTSISPCPLATNVAAVSFLSKRIMHPALVLLSGVAYTLGRVTAYAALGWIITHSILSVPQAAQFLQKYMPRALGPVLIVVGLFLLEILKMRLPGIVLSEKHRSKLVESGAIGAFLLGLIFAMAFCPVSAALFFGSLIPLALQSKFGAILPVIYGIGTGLPVLAFAIAIATGVTSLGHWFHKLSRLEYYMRLVTGSIFVLVGMYYTGVYLLKFGISK